MILENDKLVQRNKELEKQVAILKNYAEKDSMSIGYEECLDIHPFLFEKNEGNDKEQTVQSVEKGKEKVEGESEKT